MTENEAIEVIKNEKECVLRNIHGCDRDCGKCDLLMEDKAIIEGYDMAISALQESSQRHTVITKEKSESDMSLAEALEHLNDIFADGKEWECEECKNEHIVLMGFLQELEQYRSIGTISQCKTYKGIAEKTFSVACLDMKIIDELREYKNIGTVEQFRDSMEKQKAKNPVKHDNCGNKCASDRCPNCFEIVNGKHCENCGQALKWED